MNLWAYASFLVLIQEILQREVKKLNKKERKQKKQNTSSMKQSVSERELLYLRESAEISAIAAFGDRKPLVQ